MALHRTIAIIGCWLCWNWCATMVSAAELDGRVELQGPAPAPMYLPIDRDAEACGSAPKRSARLIVSAQGGVQNAVVVLPDAPAPVADGAPAVMDQRGCEFVPHMLCVRPGVVVRFLNSDPAVHETRCFHDAEMLTRFTMPPRARPVERQFHHDGPLLVRCGLHPWMHAWIYVVPHGRYTVTDAAGRFQLPDVPPGTYQLRVWHEQLGSFARTVTAGNTPTFVTVSFTQTTQEKRP